MENGRKGRTSYRSTRDIQAGEITTTRARKPPRGWFTTTARAPHVRHLRLTVGSSLRRGVGSLGGGPVTYEERGGIDGGGPLPGGQPKTSDLDLPLSSSRAFTDAGRLR